jgi:hypothetical protein
LRRDAGARIRAFSGSSAKNWMAGTRMATTLQKGFDAVGGWAGRRQPRRLPLAGAAAALSIWFSGMALLAVVVDPPAVVVFGPRQTLLEAVDHADASLISMGRWFAVARSKQSGIARKLYAGGAWFVWPAIAGTCLPVQR